MIKSKLVLISQEKCVPCKVLKNQIEYRMDELEELNAEFQYISLDELEDKDTFIQAHKLTATPTTWIINAKGETIKNHPGYIDVDTIMDWLEEVNK